MSPIEWVGAFVAIHHFSKRGERRERKGILFAKKKLKKKRKRGEWMVELVVQSEVGEGGREVREVLVEMETKSEVG